MYDFGAAQPHWTYIWEKTRDHLRADGIDAPQKLTRSADPWLDWRDPQLLLSQTCGLPFRTDLHDTLTLVGAPVWSVPDTAEIAPGRYHSVILKRADDARQDISAFEGARLAYNDPLSQSGWGLMHQLCLSKDISFSACLRTGSHHASAVALAQGRADIAAVDVVSWAHVQRVEPCCSTLSILTRTTDSPALPFVTAQPDLADPLFHALKSALMEAPAALREALCFAPEGLTPAKVADYMSIVPPPAPASCVRPPLPNSEK